MADAVLRASGEVLRFQVKTGELDNGKPWKVRTARLLLADAEILDVRVPDDVPAPEVGAEVDLWVSVELRQFPGSAPSLRFVALGPVEPASVPA